MSPGGIAIKRQVFSHLLATILLVSLGPNIVAANVIRLQPVMPGQAFDKASTPGISMPQSVNIGSITITAQASLVEGLTLVRVNVKNGTGAMFVVSPHLFSAADGNLLMLKLMEPASVTSILQVDLSAIQAQNASSLAYQPPSGPDPFVQTLSSYMFGRMGMKGDTRDFAASVTAGVIQNMNQQPMPSFLSPPDITPGMVARESLDSSELEPGYSAEGIIFFTVPKKLPLNIKVNLAGKKATMTFDASAVPESVHFTKMAEETSVGSATNTDLFYGMSSFQLIAAIAAKGGSCRPPERETRNSVVEYVDCSLASTMTLANNQGGILDTVLGTTNRTESLSEGAWTWVFRNGKLVNHKATITSFR